MQFSCEARPNKDFNPNTFALRLLQLLVSWPAWNNIMAVRPWVTRIKRIPPTPPASSEVGEGHGVPKGVANDEIVEPDP